MWQIMREELSAVVVFLIGAAIVGACGRACLGCSSQVQTACGVVDLVDVACDHVVVRVRGEDGVTRTVRVDLDGGTD